LNVNQVVHGGNMVHIDPHGELVGSRVIPLKMIGSFSDCVHITNIYRDRSKRGKPLLTNEKFVKTSVYISGNPQKFLFGQNIYGTNDLRLLMKTLLPMIAERLGFDKFTQDQWAHLGLSGNYELTRIDITENFRIGKTSKDVQDWLAAAQEGIRCAHKDARLLYGSTLYLGQHSRRHSVKLYDKQSELMRHPPKLSVDINEKLYVECAGMLRIESTFRSRKLRDDGINTAQTLDAKKVTAMYYDSISKVKLSQQVVNRSINRLNVGRSAYMTYLEWCQNVDVRQSLSRSAFYRNRGLLLPFGVDISIPKNDRASNVVAFMRPLVAVPCYAPDWMYEENLLFKKVA
jgi:hypothetical protein